MSDRKVLICDDDERAEKRWRDKLQRRFDQLGIEFEALILEPADILGALESLGRRRALSRENKGLANEFPSDGAGKLDEADIFVIDFDLFRLEGLSHVTGEMLAYLARCYSGCGLIIAVNQFEEGRNMFDLTLSGHPETFADLHVGDPQLDNAGLWAEPWEGFRPWAWPLLPLAMEKFEQRVRNLGDHLDKPVLEFLGLADLERRLARSVLEFPIKSDKPREVTFRDFVTTSRNGLRRRDKPFSRESIAQIAAARLGKWLDSMVLLGQDTLVDAPHLISRYPSLVQGDSKDIDAWNETASFGGLEGLGLHHATIEQFRFQRDEWLSRSVWFWGGVSGCEDIAEVADPWSTDRPDFVFCEDVSRFLPRDQAREFVADLPSPFVRRFAKGLADIEYVPRPRLFL